MSFDEALTYLDSFIQPEPKQKDKPNSSENRKARNRRYYIRSRYYEVHKEDIKRRQRERYAKRLAIVEIIPNENPIFSGYVKKIK